MSERSRAGEPDTTGDARPERSPPSRLAATLTVARYEGERRLWVTAALALALVVFGGLFVLIAPSVTGTPELAAITESLPPGVAELFGLTTLTSLAGVLGGEFYSLGWVLGLGGYLAYTAATSVAGDLRADRVSVVLAGPVARSSVLTGKFLALLVPVVVVNAVVPVALFAGALAVGDGLSAVDLLAVHLLSVPYLLCWGAVGLLLGVVVRRGRTAGRVGLGVVFAAWLVEALVSDTVLAPLGWLSPARYFDPAATLVESQFDLVGAAVLLGTTAVALALARVAFASADL
jgi:ABC-2 type transport system permease protein